MRIRHWAMAIVAPAALAACAHEKPMAASAPPAWPGAIAGTVAADRNGDGIADGWYTADGIYHAFTPPPCPPPPPPLPSRRGERG